ncbi:acetylornithine deacetylase or succinyl-diaminopimelate desuccinylase [Candidatus Methanoperedens nitroreducens]|uniref:Acetylornithine deacetylase or succinyl-diaminopimelate desuccinylase n=1 Tax=Candidatus Methanoperedens nitratireducens TaxID=1392998 RepID=A0A062V5S3_9EURY|nr:ArgE/DapE family deacylase [Candidatus Methanoperedens nitroreducens]KCZ70760.1 acetylornithine deacetylase or succinyl-diaminopimelate desuccinylase [Candidatus Methanoperedens nitroreducens]MDJ1420617.1 ArgE/DapE family deacylase [Candidatus Methanoperedens sp.]
MKALFDYLESCSSQALDTLDELVRIPTQVPPGENYERAVDLMIEKLADLGFKVEKLIMPRELFEKKNPRLSHLPGERANLSAIRNVGAEKTLLINTHLDVVPASANWSVPPFECTVRDGRIFGRGVADSKGGPAALLTVLSAMRELDIEPEYNLNIALTTDEEMGPYSGLCYLADLGKLGADYFLSMDGDSDDITIASNGNVDWQIDISGRSYHSGSSFLGVNAIERSIPVMNELMKLKAEIEKRRSKVPASMAITRRTGLRTLVPVLNINIINAGVKQNIIPDRCTLKGDRRFIPEERFDDVCKEMSEAISRARQNNPDIVLKWSCDEIYAPMLTDMSHPWVKEVQSAASEVAGREIGFAGAQGSLDVAYAVRVTGLPACCFGIGRRTESNAHADDENIRMEDLVMYMKFLARLICG